MIPNHSYQHVDKLIYVVKMTLCALIVTALSIAFDQSQVSNFFLWSSLTAFFTIQADIQSKVNFNQITGNLIGSSIGIFAWVIISKLSMHHTLIYAEYWLILMGIICRTIICVVLNHIEYCGIALSGLLIVTVYDVSHNTFEGALLRVLYCLFGCIIAYCVDAMSRRIINH